VSLHGLTVSLVDGTTHLGSFGYIYQFSNLHKSATYFRRKFDWSLLVSKFKTFMDH
jgi:hypothetical protein